METLINKNMEEVFDLTGTKELINIESALPVPVVIEEEEKVDEVKEKSDKDFDLARENLKELIDTGKDSLETLTQLASESESPRAFEVLSGLIKTLTETNEKLIQSHKLQSTIGEGGRGSNKTLPNKDNINVERAVFVGTSKELQDQINKKDI